jgi:hypothetical protein
MEAPAPLLSEACEIERLPEEALSTLLARTSQRDACRTAAVSPTFRAGADSHSDSDSVWACFMPRTLPSLADRCRDTIL